MLPDCPKIFRRQESLECTSVVTNMTHCFRYLRSCRTYSGYSCKSIWLLLFLATHANSKSPLSNLKQAMRGTERTRLCFYPHSPCSQFLACHASGLARFRLQSRHPRLTRPLCHLQVDPLKGRNIVDAKEAIDIVWCASYTNMSNYMLEQTREAASLPTTLTR
jgi:hypothetical protein